MRDFLKLLEHSHAMTNKIIDQCETSRLDWLGNHVFDFTTYESDMSELFARKAVQVCKAINDRATFEYIRDDDGHMWYLLMCNMPFFSRRLNWGTSIRGAWWDFEQPEIDTMTLFDGDAQILSLKLSQAEWKAFAAAIVTFGSHPNAGYTPVGA